MVILHGMWPTIECCRPSVSRVLYCFCCYGCCCFCCCGCQQQGATGSAVYAICTKRAQYKRPTLTPTHYLWNAHIYIYKGIHIHHVCMWVSVVIHAMNFDEEMANGKDLQWCMPCSPLFFCLRILVQGRGGNGLWRLVDSPHQGLSECKDITFHCSISSRYRALTVI